MSIETLNAIRTSKSKYYERLATLKLNDNQTASKMVHLENICECYLDSIYTTVVRK